MSGRIGQASVPPYVRSGMSTSAPSPYLRIAEELGREIAAGRLGPGARVPSTRAIVERWGVAMATATKALSELRRRGLVRAVPGVGTVVEGHAPDPQANATPQGREQRATPGELTTERIVADAIAVADAEGIRAVSMRRVASQLGVATMSLYRHVEDKDDLLLKMIDAAFAEWRPPADPPPGWRARLELSARGLWGLCRRHPWLAPAMSITRPQPTAGGLDFSEFTLTALERIGMDHEATLTAYITLATFVRGTALNIESEEEAQAATGLHSEQWLDANVPQLRALADSRRFPTFTRYVSEEYDFSLDALFEFGLHCMLEGLEAIAAPRAR
jgi:AcrR family transcriptional regulator